MAIKLPPKASDTAKKIDAETKASASPKPELIADGTTTPAGYVVKAGETPDVLDIVSAGGDHVASVTVQDVVNEKITPASLDEQLVALTQDETLDETGQPEDEPESEEASASTDVESVVSAATPDKYADGEAIVTASKQVTGQVLEVSSDTVPMGLTPKASEPMAEVGVDLSMTVNLGDYNSAKLGVSIRLPSPVAEIDQSYEQAKQWANDRLETLIGEVTG